MEDKDSRLIEIEMDDEAPEEFDCGNTSINRLVKNSFFLHLINQQKVFKIVFCGQIVGFYAFSMGRIQEESIDLEFQDSPEFGIIYLNYIAVDKRFQRNGIGTTLLERIILRGRTLSEAVPARLLVLDALQEKSSWYGKHAFIPFKEDSPNGKQRMYFDLLSPERLARIAEYSEQ